MLVFVLYNKPFVLISVTFKDHETAEKIMRTKSQREHKRLGRLVKNFDEDVWRIRSIEIVRQANYLKFTQDIELRDRLLLTHPKELVEASPYDRIWGVGMSINDPRIESKHLWRGRNLLGQILVDIRDKIKESMDN